MILHAKHHYNQPLSSFFFYVLPSDGPNLWFFLFISFTLKAALAGILNARMLDFMKVCFKDQYYGREKKQLDQYIALTVNNVVKHLYF